MQNDRMKILLIAAALVASSVGAQEAYRCKTAGGFVIQDTPCKVTVSDRTQPPAAAVTTPAQPATPRVQERLAKDKEYLDKRAYERARGESLDNIRFCEMDASSIQAQIEYTAAQRGPEYVPNHVGLQAMQLDEERRQTALAALQSRVSAKRYECAELRRAHEARYK